MTPAAVAAILRRQGMPPEEIADVLDDDAVLARRRLELHRERLREWLRTQGDLIASIERSIGATAERVRRTAS